MFRSKEQEEKEIIELKKSLDDAVEAGELEDALY